MNRREFMTLIGGAAAWPLAARAQQPATPVIGFLNSGSSNIFADRARAFRQGLSETGYVEGRNAVIEYRWADGQDDRLPTMAADLVRRNVSVIATGGGIPSALAAKAATTTIPIVFQVGGDPVERGLVTSLNRPGGNLTGVTVLALELGQKTLELLHEVAPKTTTIAFLVNPTNPTAETISKEVQAAARTLGLQLQVLHASAERDFDAAFAALAQRRAGGLVIGGDPYFSSRSELLATLTVRHGVPAIYPFREFAVGGGLMSYGGSLTDAYRQVGVYCGRILKGETPSDLPIQRSAKLELIINFKTAKALGLEVPLFLQQRADEVIE
jgi:putative tryptophan/tyrosine transport system substrate-binding protein